MLLASIENLTKSVFNCFTNITGILEVNSCWWLVIAQKNTRASISPILWAHLLGDQDGCRSSSLYRRPEGSGRRSGASDICPLYQESKDLPEAPGEFHLHLIEAETVSHSQP